jgi:mitochondrial import inner membrane translocase subunit TIM44
MFIRQCVTKRSNSSFIRHVMDQVKQELEEAKRTTAKSQDWQKVSESASSLKDRVKDVKEKVSPSYVKAKDMFAKMKEAAGERAVPKQTATEQRILLIKAKFGQVLEHESVAKAAALVQSSFNKYMDKSQKLINKVFADPKKAPELSEKWKQQQASAKPSAPSTAPDSNVSDIPHPHSDAVVVSTHKPSAWDRMGLGMDSMPFLSETVSRLVGESEIAQCTREMKEIDPSFRISHLFDEMEEIVIPQFLKWFLEGDAAALKAHCGEAAFAASSNSIKARIVQKCKPDTRVLLGPREIELRLAVPADLDGSPCFVFQFTTQQVNCFRDGEGNVVEGSEDDIREMHYMIAIQRNLKEDQSDLQHPWLIRELAIVGNRKTW